MWSRRYSIVVVQIVERSNRTPQRSAPSFTGANGAVWICPLLAIEHTQRPGGGAKSIASNADGSALFCAWIRGPKLGAEG